MNESEIIAINQSLTRQLIADRAQLSIAELSRQSADDLLAHEKAFYRALKDDGEIKRWKAAIIQTFEADASGVRSFSCASNDGDITVRLDKHNRLIVKVDGIVVCDDTQPGKKTALPGDWMESMKRYVATQAEIQRDQAEDQEEAREIAQIVRLTS